MPDLRNFGILHNQGVILSIGGVLTFKTFFEGPDCQVIGVYYNFGRDARSVQNASGLVLLHLLHFLCLLYLRLLLFRSAAEERQQPGVCETHSRPHRKPRNSKLPDSDSCAVLFPQIALKSFHKGITATEPLPILASL